MTKKLQKSTIFTILFTFILICTSFLLVGCFNKVVYPERIEFESPSIEMYLNQVKTIELNVYPKKAKNYKLKCSSSDTSIISFDRYSNMVANSYGKATITIEVVDTNISQSMEVTVNDGKIAYIEARYPSSAIYYFTGERIDLKDIEVYGVYQSREKEDKIDLSQCVIEHPTYAEDGATIKITYKDLTTIEIPLIVREDRIIEMNIDSLPIKTSYFIGEKFDKTGLEVSLKYYSGRVEKITNYQIDKETIDVGDKFITITYQDFTEKISISAKAKKIVNSFKELQDAINENVDSIMLANGANFNTSTPLILENAKNITIFSQKKTDSLNGIDIIPIKIVGKIENVRFINLTLSSIGDNAAEHMIDLSQCTGGSVTFKDMTFSASQQNALLLPIDVDLSTTFNNCTFKENA